MQKIRLDPGEIFINTQPAEIYTVLGSCVSITLYHPRLKQVAMSHCRKPDQTCYHMVDGLKICRELGDYVACSLRFMLAFFDQKGIERKELIIKLFGGALMSQGVAPVGNKEEGSHLFTSMGKRNSERALELIRNERLHLTASDIGGPWARQIVFYTHTGEVQLKRMQKILLN